MEIRDTVSFLRGIQPGNSNLSKFPSKPPLEHILSMPVNRSPCTRKIYPRTKEFLLVGSLLGGEREGASPSHPLVIVKGIRTETEDNLRKRWRRTKMLFRRGQSLARIYRFLASPFLGHCWPESYGGSRIVGGTPEGQGTRGRASRWKRTER